MNPHRIVSFVVVTTAAFHPPVMADTGQQESPIVVVEGAEPVALQFGDHTSGALIDTSVDLDSYTFCGSAGDEVVIVVDGVTFCIDPRVEVFGPAGFQTSSNCQPDCRFGPESCSFYHRFVLPETGCYSLIISDLGSDEAGSYVLQLERLVPAPSVPLIAHGTQNGYRIEPTTDIDYFQFNGQAGELVRIVLDGLTACLDPEVEVLDPAGLSVTSAVCTPDCRFGPQSCSLVKDVSLTTTGVYTLVLRDNGADEVGDCRISVNCLVGCPPITQVISRNGTDFNPICLTNTWTPAIGGQWCASVDASQHPGAFMTVVFLRTQSLIPGRMTPWGELLIDINSTTICNSRYVLGPGETIGRHESSILNDASLVGLRVAAQGLIIGGGAQLCNAIDYTLGY